MAKIAYLQRYSKGARETFLNTFEGYEEDVGEKLTTVPVLRPTKKKKPLQPPLISSLPSPSLRTFNLTLPKLVRVGAQLIHPLRRKDGWYKNSFKLAAPYRWNKTI